MWPVVKWLAVPSGQHRAQPSKTEQVRTSGQTQTKSSQTPPTNQIGCRSIPIWEVELEPMRQQTAGDHSAALQDQLALRSLEPRADLDHPLGSRQADRHPKRLPQVSRELRLRQRIGRTDVHRPGEGRFVDEELDRTTEIVLVNPRHVLPASAQSAAQSSAGERTKDVEHASLVRRERERAPQQHQPRPVCLKCKSGCFPGFCDLDAGPPRRRRIRLFPAKDSRGFVVGCIESVSIDGCGAGLKPDFGRVRARRNGLAHHRRRAHSAVHHLLEVRCVVTAIHRPASQIDHGIGVFEGRSPIAERFAIP